MLPDFTARADDGLEIVGTGEPALTRELWLVTHSDMPGSASVRAVVGCLKQWFAGQDYGRAP